MAVLSIYNSFIDVLYLALYNKIASINDLQINIISV